MVNQRLKVMTSISTIPNQLEERLKSFFKYSDIKINKTFVTDIMKALLLQGKRI